MPLPFARAIVLYGEPIHVPFESDRGAMELKRQSLQSALDSLTEQAEELALGRQTQDRR